MKKFMVLVLLAAAAAAGFAPGVFAEQLATAEQGLKDMLGGAVVTPKTVTLTEAQIAAVNAVFKQVLIIDTKIPVVYTFYTTKDAGTAVAEKQMGKWGDIQSIFLIGTDGKLKNLEVLSLTEKRGRPIVLRPFLSQFVGKGIDDSIDLGGSINAVSGATISSRAMLISAKRALAVYSVVMAKKAGAAGGSGKK